MPCTARLTPLNYNALWVSRKRGPITCMSCPVYLFEGRSGRGSRVWGQEGVLGPGSGGLVVLKKCISWQEFFKD